MSVSIPRPDYDLKNAVTPNRLRSLWRLATGFHSTFIAATLALGFLAAVAKTATYLLLRRYIDDVLGVPDMAAAVPLIALAFVGLALLEGGFTFLSAATAPTPKAPSTGCATTCTTTSSACPSPTTTRRPPAS
ncbi:MAG: hypothetical protein M9927_18530 [Anaerolineae bacterium]|nr:hypothetical protein [Anaerolineae bacterium]